MCLCLPKFLALRSRRGLTLFELLTVMMILALLVSLVIGLGRYADTIAKRHQAVADLGKWQDALQRYYDVLGQYPTNSQAGTSITNLFVPVQIGGTGPSVVSVRLGDQMSTIPSTKDPWGNDYQYVATTNIAPQSFDLYSFGPDRTGNTSDDIRFQP